MIKINWIICIVLIIWSNNLNFQNLNDCNIEKYFIANIWVNQVKDLINYSSTISKYNKKL